MFNQFIYNKSLFNGAVVAVLSDLDIVYDYGLSSYIDIVYNLQEIHADLDIVYTLAGGVSTVYGEPLNIIYDLSALITADLNIKYNLYTTSEVDIVYNLSQYGHYVISDTDIVYDFAGSVTPSDLDIVYDEDVTVFSNSELEIVYNLYESAITPVYVIPVVDNFEDYGGWASISGDPIGYTDYSEVDSYFTTDVTLITPITKNEYVSGLSFSTEIFVINNSCASLHASRLLSLAPSAISDMAWQADYDFQTDNPPSAILNDILGNPLINLFRKPADTTHIEDMVIDVSVFDQNMVALPSPNKTVYIKYAPGTVRGKTEIYTGTYSEIVYNINQNSELVYASVATPVHTDKLASARGITLMNKPNSPHFSFWKMLGVLYCYLRSVFNAYIGNMFVRTATVKSLSPLAETHKTNQWAYLRWKELKGNIIRDVSASSGSNTLNSNQFFIPISETLFLQLQANLVRRFRPGTTYTQFFRQKWGTFKIEDELMLVDWFGATNDWCPAVGGCPPNTGPVYDDGTGYNPPQAPTNYWIHIIQRGAQETQIVGHELGAPIEYIPTELGTFGSDVSLLAKIIKEPDNIYKERLRLYQGEKTNPPSFRKVYDALEKIVPNSHIYFWDRGNMGPDQDSNNRKYVVIDKEVGWFLGVPGKTELEYTTYLGVQLYTQGYWEWVDGGPQLDFPGQIKGRYPFFVRTEKWWFDPELLKEVTTRFKAAGTTPNYAINIDVEGYSTIVEVDEPHQSLSISGQVQHSNQYNMFDNPDLSDGVAFTVNSYQVSGLPASWEIAHLDNGVLKSLPQQASTNGDYIYQALSNELDNTLGDPTNYNMNSSTIRLANNYSTVNDYFVFYQTIKPSTPPPGYGYMCQFFVKQNRTGITTLTSNDVLGFVMDHLTGNCGYASYLTIIPMADRWYSVSFSVDASIFAGKQLYSYGIQVRKDKDVLVSNALMFLVDKVTMLGLSSTDTYLDTSGYIYKSGIIKCDNEYMKYCDSMLHRGYGGSVAAVHAPAAAAYVTGIHPFVVHNWLDINYNSIESRISSSLELVYSVV